MQKPYYIGVDLGGTKTAFGLFDASCRVLAQGRLPTRPAEGPAALVQCLAHSILEMLQRQGIQRAEVEALGLCSPGPIHRAVGKIVSIASVGWNNVPICALLNEQLGFPVVFENDANAAALAERLYGAGTDLPADAVMAYVTVSTGIGCGIVFGKRVCHGKHDSAGELGHICLRSGGPLCGCGNSGCLEEYASGTAIGRAYAAEKGDASLTCREAETAARAGDKAAQAVFRRAGKDLGLGLSYLVQLLDPYRIVVGGGVANAWGLFYQDMMESVRSHCYPLLVADLSIVPAKLGAKAGLVGAAAVAIYKKDGEELQ